MKRKKTGRTNSRKRRQTVERFWIQQIGDCKIEWSHPRDFELLITRVNLDDDSPNSSQKSDNDDNVTSSQKSDNDDNVISTAVTDMSVKESTAEHSSTQKNYLRIKRAPSAKKAPKQFHHDPNFQHLPDGDCGDGIINPYPKEQVPDKYWAQRKRLFTKYDEGIQLDKEGWYSVTPEIIANHIAWQISYGNEMIVLDAFCGTGGNAIAFALRKEVSCVICVDTDRTKLEMAANNCHVYRVSKEKVLFIHKDALEVIRSYRKGKLFGELTESEEGTETHHGYRFGNLRLLPEKLHAIFLSPPWGGMDYEKIGPQKYHLGNIKLSTGADGERLLKETLIALPDDPNLSIFLPRNTNGRSIAESAVQSGLSSCVLEQNILNDKFKTVTMYTRARQTK